MADAREGITAKAANPPTCFGLPLEEAMQLPNQKTIPTLVKQIIVFLNTEAAIKTEGLFRVSPTLTKLKELRQACERPDFSFAADLDPHLVGALLKSYLGELPEPLLTFELYPDFLAVTSLNEAQAKSQRLQELMQELPPHNRVLAEILFLFLARMVEHVENNKMTASNLAMIFGPLLLRPQVETIDSMMHGPKVTAIVKHLVEHYDQIFRKGKSGTTTTTAGASLPSPFSSSSSTPTIAGMRLLQGENAEEKLVQIVKALDDAIALVQNKLAVLRQQLEQTQSMEEAIQIARKIRTAKRILFLDGEGRGGGTMPSSTSSRMTPKQLNRQHRRSIAILAAASPQTPLRPESSASALKGRRRTMEDAHVLVDDLRKHFPNATFPTGSSACSFSFYGVYDGHGGSDAAELTAKTLHEKIVEGAAFGRGRMEEALRNGFQATDRHILTTCAKEGWKNGTTAVCCLLQGRRLWIANVGDSEAVLAKRNLQPQSGDQTNGSGSGGGYLSKCITVKHKPTEKEEKERIQGIGGHIVFGRVFGDLAVSRALGDADYKKPISDVDFISAEPFVQEIELSHTEDDFLILACDGLWDCLSYQEAVELVGTSRDKGKDVHQCCSLLANASYERGSKDNISVVLVFFNWL